ncbi:MAG TPA: hypothetical protein VKA34_03700 [Balneolales bacterium]|nr:hypothetical protein [Balneolales bacterium]
MKFYIDENIAPQIGRALSILQKPLPEKVEVLTIRDEYGKGASDEEWIPEVGKENGIVITQDLNIQRIKQQRDLYRKYKLGVVFLKPPSKNGFSYWDMVTKIIESWPFIKKIAKKEKKPFAYVIRSRSKRLESL